MPSQTAWHAYDGWFGRPKAALLRGACVCRWRGAAECSLDWTVLDDQTPLYEADVDLAGPITDFKAHLTVVRDAAVPLPEPVTTLLTALTQNLETAAVTDLLVTLKALADLRYLIAGVGADAASAVQAGRIPMETVATALCASETATRRYANSHRHP
ncbi:hypothetical protein [Streptomyces sp. NBC_01439]|uniref:hypothetical protein n=1 Tax=Streptomyces sp. NBC_01439 TaxID=2903867 RepID=UPI002E2BDA2E|nr:hypothetical protein [Streptomyces sp. NBC_01439]